MHLYWEKTCGKYQRMSSAHPGVCAGWVPKGTSRPLTAPLGAPSILSQPRISCQALGLPSPAPAMPQQGQSPAPHSPALPSHGVPLNWAHCGLMSQPVSIPRQVPRPGAALLLSGAEMGSGSRRCPDRPLEVAGPGGVLPEDSREEH